MNKYEKGLAALDKLFENTTVEEFERDYLAAEAGIGITVEDYLKDESSRDEIFTGNSFQSSFDKPVNKLSKEYYVGCLEATYSSCSNDEMEIQGLAA